MRQEIIDLSGEQRVGHGTRYIGTVGEHNATELVLTVPSELLKAAEYAVVLFDVGDTVFRSVKIPVKGRKKTPPAWVANGAVHILIDHKVSGHPRVAIQVELAHRRERQTGMRDENAAADGTGVPAVRVRLQHDSACSRGNARTQQS